MYFNDIVKSIIEPVLVSFGFTIKQDIIGILEYDHKYLTITLSYDYNSSYEVSMTLLFKENGSFYGYDELEECFYNKKANLSTIQTNDENTLIKWMEEVSRFLKDNLKNIIDNYREVQSRLEGIRQRRVDIYERERNDRLLNEGVEKYWEVKDYSGLVKFLKSYKGEFAGSIKKKYEYALRMIE